ncbi:MAG: hypothetical protein ACT4QB_20430 [Gammaproteobacteria bacterium]
MIRYLFALVLPALAIAPPTAPAYPLDGDAATGIRRLTHARLVQAGQLPGPKQPPGELLSLDHVDLSLLGHQDLDLPRSDPELTREVVGLLGRMADRYAIAVLDVSDPAAPRYAEHGGEVRRNPGSVGKLCAALAVFQALADIYPKDEAARAKVLRDSMITADAFVLTDSHSVRLYQPGGKTLIRRPLRVGDRGSLYEFLDWMLSASSNSAAAVVMQQAMLLRHFKTAYPVTPEVQGRFFRETPRGELARLYIETFEAPLSRNGLDLTALRQGSFFTREGKRRVPGSGPSYGTARELMKFLLRMDQGRLVDAFSSREMKRLTYMTERRIRYASSPALSDAAVYFKSGSLYKCAPGSPCRKYHGTVINFMNSVAIVESPAGSRRLYYLVALMSNVLGKNSAVDHQTLATRLHRLIEKRHSIRPPAAAR